MKQSAENLSPYEFAHSLRFREQQRSVRTNNFSPTRTERAPHPGAYVRGAPLTRVFFGFRRSRNSVSFDACQRNEQKSSTIRTLCSLSLPQKNFFQKIPTFFQKPLDKSTIIVYNIPRYPKTAGFRKSVPLSCRGRRQFNPHGCTTSFLRAELWH